MELAVTKRDNTKKAAILRREGVLPAVVYGRAHESTPISVDQKTFEKLFSTAGESTIITLTGLGEDKQVLVNEVERHPVSGALMHADFYAIAKGQKVTVSIPLSFEGISPAVKELGGILTKVLHELEIECEPKDLPRSIVVDVSKLATLDDQIQVKDLTFPAGADVSAEQDDVVAMISVAEEEPVEEVAADLSAIEISEDRGKKEDEVGPGAEGAAPATKAEAPKQSKEKKE